MDWSSRMVRILAMGALRNLSLLPGCIRAHGFLVCLALNTHQPYFWHLWSIAVFCIFFLRAGPHGLDSAHGGREESFIDASLRQESLPGLSTIWCIARGFSCVIQVQQIDLFWGFGHFNKWTNRYWIKNNTHHLLDTDYDDSDSIKIFIYIYICKYTYIYIIMQRAATNLAWPPAFGPWFPGPFTKGLR